MYLMLESRSLKNKIYKKILFLITNCKYIVWNKENEAIREY